MNAKQINEFRIAHGLKPIVIDHEAKMAAKRRQAANRMARAQASYDLKMSRSRNKSK